MANVSDTDDTYDYVIIGGGTSGAVVARRLAEVEANYSVCLLEAGPRLVYLSCIIVSENISILIKVMSMYWTVTCPEDFHRCSKQSMTGVMKLFLKKEATHELSQFREHAFLEDVVQ